MIYARVRVGRVMFIQLNDDIKTPPPKDLEILVKHVQVGEGELRAAVSQS